VNLLTYLLTNAVNITGVLKTKRLLDRESVAEYYLTVVAQDGGGLQCRSTVHVRLTDVNDNPPQFVPGSHYAVSVPEDASVGTPVLRVAAVDPDTGVSRRILYSMQHPHVGIVFTIDAVSGVITLMQLLDREQRASYNLTVLASDQVRLCFLSFSTDICCLLHQWVYITESQCIILYFELNNNANNFVTIFFFFKIWYTHCTCHHFNSIV